MVIFKKTIFFILIIASILVLTLRLVNQFGGSLFPVNEKSGIKILSNPAGVPVFLNDRLVGKTPYEDQSLVAGQYRLKIDPTTTAATSSGLLVWQGRVKLSGGTLTIVNRDLAKETPAAAGEIITLEKGHGVTIISSPAGSVVEIDGKDYGTTPVALDIQSGEHIFVLKHSGYLNRSIKALVVENFNLVLNVELALSEADLSNVATPTPTQTSAVVVKNTPSGFLRVRDKGDLSGRELTRVAPGDILVLLDEQDDWDHVRLPDGSEGFVSRDYVEKKNP